MDAFEPQPCLTTDRLLLRPFEHRDVDDVLTAVSGDAELLRWMPWAHDYDRAEAVRWCQTAAHSDPQRAVNLAIEPRTGPGAGRVSGCVGLTAAWEHGQAEVGYWIAAWARGNGYAGEAARALAAYAFGRGLHRVELLVAIGNLPSQRVAIKSGFTREGVLREARPVPGGRSDMIIFSLLRHDPS
jgi:RimJ/RimL family protein N-acetyltransferase